MIEITVTADGQEPRKHRFDAPQIAIGRDADNDLVLDSKGCSRHHARIVREGGGYRIVDLGSTNGLLFGTQVVRELPLADRLEVTIGEHRLSFGMPGQKAPEATVRMFYGSPDAIAPPPPPAPPTAPLYLVSGSGRKERVLKLVPGGEYTLGRSPSADLVIEDRECSKRHAMVYERGGGFHFVDLESVNGSFLNGERVRDTPLSAGDEILIGQTSVRVQDQILDIADRANLLDRTLRGVPALSRMVEGEPGAPTARRARPWPVALAVVALLAVAAGAYFAGRRPWTADSPAPSPRRPAAPSADTAGPSLVQIAPAVVRELVDDLTGSGSVKARRSVTVSAEVPGRVLELLVAEGSAVERGTPLVRLGDSEIRHQIEAARASISREQVTLAKADYERKQRLFQDGAVVRSVVEQARNRYLTLDSTYRSTRANISQLEAQLGKTRVAAPIAGLVTRVFVAEGEFVGPGAPLAMLENMDEVLVRTDLADRDFVRVAVGQPVEATAAAFAGEVFMGEVTRLGSAADPVTRTFEVEARLANPGLRLRPGLIVSLRIILDREQGLLVPAEAVIGEAVFVVRDGTVRRVEVRLGRRLDREVEVLEGLAEGDEVVVVGAEGLADGQAVETYREP